MNGVKTLRKRYRYSWILLREMVKTDFKLRYQGSALGVLWSVLKPLMLFVVMYLVFVKFLKMTDGTVTYPIVLLLGIEMWGFFTESTSIGLQSIVARGDLLRKVNFPKYIIAMSTICSALISLVINVAIVIAALLLYAIFSKVNLSLDVLWLPLNFLELILITFGVVLFLSALFVEFRDIAHIWDVALQVLFYSMPIVYPLTMGIFIKMPIIAKLLLMNPLAQTIQDIRHNLISSTVPTLWGMTKWYFAIIPVILAIAIFIFGAWFFRKRSRTFAEDL